MNNFFELLEQPDVLLSPEQLLGKALDHFGDRMALACSFGLEDVALVHILASLNRPFRIFSLDTGRLNEETYLCAERICMRYGVRIEWQFPDRLETERLETQKGFFSFRESIENRKECCGIRKVVPLNRVLSGLDAWVTGQRREQSVTRTELHEIEKDPNHEGMTKINPLADWSLTKTWEFIKENEIPYNVLHDRAYPSIGCAPCTRAIEEGEDERAGRWWWENPEQKECGLHLNPNRGTGI